MDSRKGPKALASLVAVSLDAVARKRGFSTAEILMRWEAIAGPELARCSRPERVVWPRRAGADAAGTLHLLVRPSASLDVQHARQQILERVNTVLGWRAVGDIRLRQAPGGKIDERRRAPREPLPDDTVQALESALSGIEEPELRSALRRLGASALRPVATR